MRGRVLARTAVSGTAPHPHSASLRVSLSPQKDAGRGTLDRLEAYPLPNPIRIRIRETHRRAGDSVAEGDGQVRRESVEGPQVDRVAEDGRAGEAAAVAEV